jgi:hypothetical protein
MDIASITEIDVVDIPISVWMRRVLPTVDIVFLGFSDDVIELRSSWDKPAVLGCSFNIAHPIEKSVTKNRGKASGCHLEHLRLGCG